MSLFGRRLGRGRKKDKKQQKIEPAARGERHPPTLDVGARESGRDSSRQPDRDAIKAKVQSEVCAVLARTILELIQSSQARAPAMDELLRRQAINRLYADVLYDFLAGGEAPGYDPGELVLGWAREAMDEWGAGRERLAPGLAGDKAALSDAILAALEAASRDRTLREAARQRLEAAARSGPASH